MIISVVLVLLGLGIAITALIQFKQHQTTFDPLHPNKASALVCSGIFSLTRNPMYLGLLLLLLSVVCYFGNINGVIVVILFVLYITQFQIKPEERALEDVFGDEFLRYKKTTRRWL